MATNREQSVSEIYARLDNLVAALEREPWLRELSASIIDQLDGVRKSLRSSFPNPVDPNPPGGGSAPAKFCSHCGQKLPKSSP
jgi:hypothetical protein